MEAEAAQVTPSGGDSEVGAASEPVIAAAPDPNPAKVPSDGAAANTPASAQTPKDSESKAEVTSDAAALSPAEHAVKLRAQGLEVAVAVTPPDMKDPLDRIRTNVALCAGGENAPKAEWLWRYWGMGPHKWREAIDGRHWKHGPAVYDYCLHGGNGGMIDPGYLGAMFNGFDCVASMLGLPTTVDSWFRVHMCTMSHLCELNPGVAGTARDGVNYVNVPPSWEGSPNGITERAKAEIAAMRPEVCKLVPNEVEEGQPEGSAGFKLMFLEFDRDTIRANLQAYIDEYYRRLAEVQANPESTDVDLVRPIAWLHQAMYRMEPSQDGNARTANLFMTKHLIEVGLYPTLLGWPDGAEVFEHERWVREVIIGMQWFVQSVAVTSPELATQLHKIPPPEWTAEAATADPS